MRRLSGPCVAALLLLTAATGSAQDREAARRIFEEATRQFDVGNHQLALDGFHEARDLLAGDERAQILLGFNIARAQEELQRYDEALRSYQEYVDRAPSDAPYREHALDRIRELRARLAQRPRASGGDSPLVVVGGIVAGVGALAALAAIPTGVLALDAGNRLQQMCGGSSCPQSLTDLRDEAYTLGLTTDVLWIAGVSVAAVGVGLLITGLVTSPETPRVGAFCTGDGCAATLSLRF